MSENQNPSHGNMQTDNILALDFQAIRNSKREEDPPQGYVLPNGVVVVWHCQMQNNMATEQFAMSQFPNLVIFHRMK